LTFFALLDIYDGNFKIRNPEKSHLRVKIQGQPTNFIGVKENI